MDYQGVIIEESLADRAVLQKMKILSTQIVEVTGRHQTPWLSQWTLHTVEIPENQARTVAEAISRAFDHSHPGSWYADFKNDACHYLVFPGRIFPVERNSRTQYLEAKHYGLALGIPEHQLDFPLPPA